MDKKNKGELYSLRLMYCTKQKCLAHSAITPDFFSNPPTYT